MTKAKSNKLREEEFLKLSPVERVMAFFELSRRVNKFPTKNTPDPKENNFVLKRK